MNIYLPLSCNRIACIISHLIWHVFRGDLCCAFSFNWRWPFTVAMRYTSGQMARMSRLKQCTMIQSPNCPMKNFHWKWTLLAQCINSFWFVIHFCCALLTIMNVYGNELLVHKSKVRLKRTNKTNEIDFRFHNLPTICYAIVPLLFYAAFRFVCLFFYFFLFFLHLFISSFWV